MSDGEENENVASTYSSIGEGYWTWASQEFSSPNTQQTISYLDKAVVYFERALSIQVRVLELTDSAFAMTYLGLGRGLFDKARLEKKSPPDDELDDVFGMDGPSVVSNVSKKKRGKKGGGGR